MNSVYRIRFDNGDYYAYIIEEKMDGAWLYMGKNQSAELAERDLRNIIKVRKEQKSFPRYYDEEGNCLS